MFFHRRPTKIAKLAIFISIFDSNTAWQPCKLIKFSHTYIYTFLLGRTFLKHNVLIETSDGRIHCGHCSDQLARNSKSSSTRMKTVIGRARLIVDPSRGNYIYPIIWGLIPKQWNVAVTRVEFCEVETFDKQGEGGGNEFVHWDTLRASDVKWRRIESTKWIREYK